MVKSSFIKLEMVNSTITCCDQNSCHYEPGGDPSPTTTSTLAALAKRCCVFSCCLRKNKKKKEEGKGHDVSDNDDNGRSESSS